MMQAKRHALTQLGDKNARRFHVRRDANCPVVTHARKANASRSVAVPSWLINLSEDGCLIASDDFPKRVAEVYIVIPGLGSKVNGKVRKQGQYTLHVEFTTALTADIVNKVARIKTVARSKPASVPSGELRQSAAVPSVN